AYGGTPNNITSVQEVTRTGRIPVACYIAWTRDVAARRRTAVDEVARSNNRAFRMPMPNEKWVPGFTSRSNPSMPRGPVRDCHMALGRMERQLFRPRGHSFDVARSGYINLLQPQERRSKQPGDSAAAIAARRRLHDRGVTEPLLHAIAEAVAAS